MKVEDAVLAFVGSMLWLATIVFELMGIWLPSWQWAATGGVAFLVGSLFLALAAA